VIKISYRDILAEQAEEDEESRLKRYDDIQFGYGEHRDTDIVEDEEGRRFVWGWRDKSYTNMNDAARKYPDLIGMREGDTKIWFATPEYWKQAHTNLYSGGLKNRSLDVDDWQIDRENLAQSWNLNKTHVMVGSIANTNLEKIFDVLNPSGPVENWSPHTEAKSLMHSLGLGYRDMSVGDVVQIGNKFYLCDMSGWTDLETKLKKEKDQSTPNTMEELLNTPMNPDVKDVESKINHKKSVVRRADIEFQEFEDPEEFNRVVKENNKREKKRTKNSRKVLLRAPYSAHPDDAYLEKVLSFWTNPYGVHEYACWVRNKNDDSYEWGHYFKDPDKALEFFNSRGLKSNLKYTPDTVEELLNTPMNPEVKDIASNALPMKREITGRRNYREEIAGVGNGTKNKT